MRPSVAVICAVATAVVTVGLHPGAARAADLPPQEPGVTLRTFDTRVPISEICTLKPGQTPNVDKLLPTVDWNDAGTFGLEDHFVAHVLTNLTVPADGAYQFRVTSDDGAKLYLNDALAIDNDGLHGVESKDATVTLAAGTHPLRIEYF